MRKQAYLLLIVIYIAFIALGLPDALLGSSWNLVREDLRISLGSLGLMTVVTYVMSTLSTFNAPRLLRHFSTKKIVFISVMMTSMSLLIMSQVNSFYAMVLFAIPLGAGAGAIDVSLNHYLAKHYKASHMNYLHSFYGIGITLGPTIMALTLKEESWRLGYIIVGFILFIISLVILFSMKLWHQESKSVTAEEHEHIPLKTMLKKRGSSNSILIFLLYVHLESLIGVWIASYIFIEKGVSYSTAALFTTIYFLGLTVGRILSGFASHKMRSKHLILIGEFIVGMSITLLILNPFNHLIIFYIIVFLFGLGTAPIYPNMMYLNNDVFKREEISRMMSLQMGIGYIGFGLLTPLAGLFFDLVSMTYYPYFILLVTLLLVTLTIYYFRHKNT